MKRTGILVTLFGISMGLLESAVVIYIRELLYPGGFDFPLATLDEGIAVTEVLRELSTLVILLTLALLAGRDLPERFAWFLYSFGIWDIFYYVFLRLLAGWPESLMTWDILFLIPVTWVGPVITPVILSVTMILFSWILLRTGHLRGKAVITGPSWALLIGGSLVLILSFTWDYSGYILAAHPFCEIWTLPRDSLYELAAEYIPRKFNWWLFGAGEGMVLAGIAIFMVQNRHRK